MSKTNSKPSVIVTLVQMMSLLFVIPVSVSAAQGDLLWQNWNPVAGNYGSCMSIATSGHLVFAVSEVGNLADLAGLGPSDNIDGLVRAIDSKTGQTVWEDRIDAGPDDQLRQVVSDGEHVFVAGTVRTTRSSLTADLILLTYDAQSGQLLWFKRINKGRTDFGHALVTKDGRVFVGGQVTNAAGNRDFYVRAMNADTGALLWEDQLDRNGFEADFALAADDDHLVAAGTNVSPSGAHSLIVRSYNTRTGELIWSDVADGFSNFEVRDSALAIEDELVFVGGRALNGSATSFDFMVRAYDLGTGAVQWEDLSDRGGSIDTVFDLTVQGDRVIAVGQGGPGGLFNGDIVIRAYQAHTGSVEWEHQFDVAGGDDYLQTVALQGGRVATCGAISNAQGEYDLIVQVYDVETGALQWQDQIDVGNFDIVPAAHVLALHGNQVFVGATLGDIPPGSTVAAVRAYRFL